MSSFHTGPTTSHLSQGTGGHRRGVHPIKCRRILIKSHLNEFWGVLPRFTLSLILIPKKKKKKSLHVRKLSALSNTICTPLPQLWCRWNVNWGAEDFAADVLAGMNPHLEACLPSGRRCGCLAAELPWEGGPGAPWASHPWLTGPARVPSCLVGLFSTTAVFC